MKRANTWGYVCGKKYHKQRKRTSSTECLVSFIGPPLIHPDRACTIGLPRPAPPNPVEREMIVVPAPPNRAYIPRLARNPTLRRLASLRKKPGARNHPRFEPTLSPIRSANTPSLNADAKLRRANAVRLKNTLSCIVRIHRKNHSVHSKQAEVVTMPPENAFKLKLEKELPLTPVPLPKPGTEDPPQSIDDQISSTVKQRIDLEAASKHYEDIIDSHKAEIEKQELELQEKQENAKKLQASLERAMMQVAVLKADVKIWKSQVKQAKMKSKSVIDLVDKAKLENEVVQADFEVNSMMLKQVKGMLSNVHVAENPRELLQEIAEILAEPTTKRDFQTGAEAAALEHGSPQRSDCLLALAPNGSVTGRPSSAISSSSRIVVGRRDWDREFSWILGCYRTDQDSQKSSRQSFVFHNATRFRRSKSQASLVPIPLMGRDGKTLEVPAWTMKDDGNDAMGGASACEGLPSGS